MLLAASTPSVLMATKSLYDKTPAFPGTCAADTNQQFTVREPLKKFAVSICIHSARVYGRGPVPSV